MSRLRPLILASASPRRRELLAALGLPFLVEPAGVDETLSGAHSLEAAVAVLARRKAEAVAARRPHALVLAADTLVALGGRTFGKPADAEEARAILHALRAREHAVATAVSLGDGGALRTHVVVTRVTMRAYSEAEIAATIAAGTPFDKAGAYAIQDPLFAPVAALDGCLCNVVGLPLWTVWALLRRIAPEPAPQPPDRRRPICAACPLRPSEARRCG